MKLSILIPAYNEEESIKSTIEDIKSTIKDMEYEIIVINDNSKDKTKDILKEIENINIINNPYNLGYGASLKKGLKKAKYDWILITDADGTYPIKSIPDLLKHKDNYDMVVGARTGKNVHIPLIRKPAKKILNILANFLTGKKIPDLNSGLRLFKKAMAMEFYNMYPNGFSFTSTITLCAFTNNYTVKYIPIDYGKRTGKSSIKSRDFFGFIKLMLKIMLFFDPLKFFLWPGILFMIAGITYGIYQFLIFPTGLGQLPIILVLGGFQIIFLGFIAELVVNNKR
jgi:glycosyltransferase involved in cell wall biosynthesis